jgi:hypothetical protein
MEKKVFRSRVSVLMILPIVAIYIYVAILIFQQKAYQGLFILGGALLFMFLLCFGMRYIISGNKLYMKIFWIVPSGSINITDIISVERTYNPLSSCAASFKRLDFNFKSSYKGPSFLISPSREQEFLECLKNLNPDIFIRVSDKKSIFRFWDWDI